METLTDEKAHEFLKKLFPQNLSDPALLAAACPEGWENSPLRLAFHPSEERQYKETVTLLTNLGRLNFGKKKDLPEKPIPTFEEFKAERASEEERPATSAIEEWSELLGLCLWDLISDNHNLIGPDDGEFDFGSFRTVGGLINDFLTGTTPPEFDFAEFAEFVNSAGTGNFEDFADSPAFKAMNGYMRFYMGTSMIAGRTDLRPVYELIFTRLKTLGYRWRYVFPELHIIDFSGMKEDKPEDYDPSKAIAEEAEQKEKQAELRRMRKRIAKDTAEAKQEALDKAPPPTVQAYQAMYQTDPPGWPPK